MKTVTGIRCAGNVSMTLAQQKTIIPQKIKQGVTTDTKSDR